MTDLLGRSIGPYSVVSRLGAGGMGEVYAAHDTRLDRPVALKVLPGHLATDPERLLRFQTEARAASSINHPHILVIHDFGDVEGFPFIVTELVEGETIRQRLSRGAIPVGEAIDIAIQAAGALGAAHARGIIHRDVKPENIMVRPDGFVKVLDFGLAKLTTTDGASPTRMGDPTRLGSVVGTPRYMSPEQARGLDVDCRTDIFSLGAVLYEMLAGRAPFDATDAMAVLLAILNDPAAALPAHVSSAAPGLDESVRRGLTKARDDRYQDMAAFAADLKNVRLALEIARRTPPLRTPDADRDAHGWPSALPLQPTALFGRQAELASIQQLLEAIDARLIVLTGPGGAGKTRVAVEAAARAASRFADGVSFVPLATIQDASRVAPAIAQALGLKETAGTDYHRLLEQYLRERQLLLVLDNFEHLVTAVDVVAAVLAACPRVRVLVTSRAVLRMRGEHEVPIPPLELPDLAAPLSVANLGRVASIALFVDRARAVRPDFALTAGNAPAVAEICARLDGLPLALELAAARSRLLTPADMLARLAKRLPLLTSGPRDLPERQQTLRNAMAWSYQLLGADEQRVFSRLAVFHGGFTIEAAERVCADERVPVLDVIDALVGGSLLRRQDLPGGAARFAMLQTIREFAVDRLEDGGEVADVQRRHAEHFLSLAEEAASPQAEADAGQWYERLEADQHNLRAAFDWAAGAGDAWTTLRLGAALWRFWESRGFIREGVERLDRALLMPADQAIDRLRSSVVYAAGVLADAAGQYDRARARFHERLASARSHGDDWGVGNSLNNLGIISLRENDHETARRLYSEALTLWRRIGHRHAIALGLNNLGNVANQQGDHHEARRLHEEALEIFRDLADDRGIAQTRGHLGDVLRDLGALEPAGTQYLEALAIFRRIGEPAGSAGCLTDLAQFMRRSGDLQTARALYQEAAVIFGDLGDSRGIARVLEGIVEVAIVAGNIQRAFVLAGAAGHLRESAGAPMPPREQARFTACLAALAAPADRRDAWTQEGRSLGVETAIALALDT